MESIPAIDAIIPTLQDRIQIVIDKLPTLTAQDVHLDDSCAICLTEFSFIFAEETRLRTSASHDGGAEMEYGVTKLVECGHFFCRTDLVEWIRNFHGSCPTCRHTFADIRPPSYSDGESSDGDYFPNDEEDEEEEDDFLDGDAEDFDDMDLDVDLDEIWQDSGLTDSEMDGADEWADGETTFSEADMSISGELDALENDDIPVSTPTGDEHSAHESK